MPNIGAPELIIIALVVVLLFGATKLPTLARSVGRSMRIFKSEVKDMQTDGDAAEDGAEEGSDDRRELTESTASTPAETSTAKRQPADQR